MPADLFGFVAVTSATGRRMLLNLDLTLAIIEQEDGKATAVSIAVRFRSTKELICVCMCPLRSVFSRLDLGCLLLVVHWCMCCVRV